MLIEIIQKFKSFLFKSNRIENNQIKTNNYINKFKIIKSIDPDLELEQTVVENFNKYTNELSRKILKLKNDYSLEYSKYGNIALREYYLDFGHYSTISLNSNLVPGLFVVIPRIINSDLRVKLLGDKRKLYFMYNDRRVNIIKSELRTLYVINELLE